MHKVDVLIVGSSGLVGESIYKNLKKENPTLSFLCAHRNQSTEFHCPNHKCHYTPLFASSILSWQSFFTKYRPTIIILNSNIRHCPPLLYALRSLQNYKPRIVVTGTAARFSPSLSFSSVYRSIESLLSSSSFEYCLVRPTLIYGTNRDKNLHHLVLFAKKYGFLPAFGRINSLISPLFYDDLGQVIAKLSLLRYTGFIDVAGPKVISTKHLYSCIFNYLGQRQVVVPLCPRIIIPALNILEFFNLPLPVSSEQVLRFSEDKLPADLNTHDIFTTYPSLRPSTHIEDGLHSFDS